MKRRIIACLLCLSVAACAALPPTADRLAALPVVKLGDTPPAGDFVLRIPSGEPILTRTEIVGSLFAKEGEADVEVRLKRDLYLHKQWLSYDRVHWQRADRAVSADVQVKLPSYARPAPGVITVRLDEQ